jgi:hypothetical protein
MILPNKILLFLIGCTIAVPCFGGTCPDVGWIQSACNAEGVTDCNCTWTPSACPDSPGPYINCNELTIKIVRHKVDEVCKKGYYVSHCDGKEISLNSLLEALSGSHHRFADKCWALDGSLTTAQHYQNMRVVFNIGNTGGSYVGEVGSAYNYDNINGIIAKMDGNSQNEQDPHEGCGNLNVVCDLTNPDTTKSKCNLDIWRRMVHAVCLNASESALGVSCIKCPNDGTTLKPVAKERILAEEAQVITAELNGVPNSVPVWIINATTEELPPPHWVSFNTVADCYVTGGKDERGEFKLSHQYKCYYSKE